SMAAQIDRDKISIHALRGEGDRRGARWTKATWRFLSTPSVGRATQSEAYRDMPKAFLSTPSVGRATEKFRSTPSSRRISIHALRGEGDRYTPSAQFFA